MDDSLESLLEKATNPRNTYEDWEFIMAFCDGVNADLQGPQTALKMIVPKIRSDNDKVALLALTLLEACVKNCGQKFHQELGKFKFLNELIRMLSPKYLGESTSPAVKERIKSMLYSWKVGLPQEPKINEAYLMLKREGLIFDETVDPDRTLTMPERVKPKVALMEDPKQSQMLQKLLASKNAEDLRAANRLIRDMVRRDEKRMQKLQQRLEDVELIQNNVKLLNELLSHWKDTSGDTERQLIDELYKSIEKLRPNLFRMASELKQNEEGMTDILQTNDSVLRVMDLYTAKMGKPADSSGATATASNGLNGTKDNSAEGQASGGGGATASATSATAAATPATTTVASSSGGQATATSGGEASGRNEEANALIDLADLNFDPTPVSVGVSGNSASGGAGLADLNSSTGLSSLLDDLGALDLGTPTGANLGMFPPAATGNTGGFGVSTSQPPVMPSSGQPFAPLLTSPPQPSGMPMGAPLISSSPAAFNSSPFSSLSSSSGSQPPLVSMPPPAQQQAVPGMGMGPAVGGMGMGPSPGMANPMMGVGVSPQGGGMLGGASAGLPQQPAVDPLSVLDEAFVPLDSIQPGTLPSLPVVSKNNVSVTFHFAKEEPPTPKTAPNHAQTVDLLAAFSKPEKNIPGPGISIIVISVISTSPGPVTNFQFQAAVPKVMRVKLQPPTGMELSAYNPVMPPSSISQIMLLANPTKTKVRMKYRVSFQQNGMEVVEMGEVANFPQLS